MFPVHIKFKTKIMKREGVAARGGKFWLKSSVESTQLWSYFPSPLHPAEGRLVGFDLSFQLKLNELCSLLPQTKSGWGSSSLPPRPFWQRGRG